MLAKQETEMQQFLSAFRVCLFQLFFLTKSDFSTTIFKKKKITDATYFIFYSKVKNSFFSTFE